MQLTFAFIFAITDCLVFFLRLFLFFVFTNVVGSHDLSQREQYEILRQS